MTCPTGKIGYSRRVAEIMLTGLRARAELRIGRNWRQRAESRIYRCGKCRRWHTTSQPKHPKASTGS